jgi:hypothetical protein
VDLTQQETFSLARLSEYGGLWKGLREFSASYSPFHLFGL